MALAETYSFKGFTIDGASRRLTNDDREMVALTPKVFDLLFYLAANAGKSLSKDEIMAAVWPDAIVEESNLSQNISILRRTLGDTRGENAFIATIPGTGYKFVAPVTAASDVADETREPEIAAKSEPPQRGPSRGPVTALAAGAVVLAAIGVYLFAFADKRLPAAQRRVLAILPFKPLVAESSDETLQMGMTDTLIARLSGTSGVVLRPLSSVRKFTAADQDAQAAGRELGADAVLDGSIQRWGEKIRVNARLIDVNSGEAIWSGTFDDQYPDIFSVQDAISAKVAEALRIKLATPNGVGTGAVSTKNVDAYRLYLQGRMFQFRARPDDIRQAIGFYERAIELDPNYASAYAGIADSYRMLPITSDVAANEAFPKANAAATKALELDPNSSDAHMALGYTASWYDWDRATAEREMRRAIELNPSSPDAHRGLSIVMTILGRHDEAISEMRQARELDPLSLATNALEAQTLHYAGRDDEAIDRLNKTFEIDPNFWIARLMLARIYIGESKWDAALAELERARANSNGNTEAISLAGYVYAKTDRREQATAAINELMAAAKDNYTPTYNIALVYNGLGQSDKALTWLEKAVEEHDVRLILLKVESKWDNLRSEPRFAAVMQQVHL